MLGHHHIPSQNNHILPVSIVYCGYLLVTRLTHSLSLSLVIAKKRGGGEKQTEEAKTHRCRHLGHYNQLRINNRSRNCRRSRRTKENEWKRIRFWISADEYETSDVGLFGWKKFRSSFILFTRMSLPWYGLFSYAVAWVMILNLLNGIVP